MCNPIASIQPQHSQSADAFAERLIEIGNNAAIALMISVGHRTGLFDALEEMPPSTSEEIATVAGLNERYVREWLAAMSVGGIVLYDPVQECYRLPVEHAAFLTRGAAPDNLAVLMQYIAVLGSVEDEIVECFEQGGGVPYAKFERIHAVMAEDSGQVVESMLLEQVIPLAPGLTRKLEMGIDVLDVGCGSGRAMVQLAEAFPRSRFTGYDFSEEAIERAQGTAAEKGLSNIRFEVRDVTILPEDERYDLITTFDAVHDQAKPAQVLSAIRAALRPEGLYLMQDIAGSSRLEGNFSHPIAPLLYTISCMHCMTVSLAAGGDGLGTLWGEELALSMLDDARFGQVEVHRLDGDIQNSYYVSRPAA